MPSPRAAIRGRRQLDPYKLHQLAVGYPGPGPNGCGGWGLPWRWSRDDKPRIFAEMRAAWNENRDEVTAYAAEISKGTRQPWAERFDRQEVA